MNRVRVACTGAVVALALTAGPAFAAAERTEYAGGSAATWTNYKTAGGQRGPAIPGHKAVQVYCRRRGFKVSDGNVWWYQVASKPWDGRYYVSADAFYNNGHRTGSLHGTPFFDPRVPLC